MGLYCSTTSLSVLMTGTDFSLTAIDSLASLSIERAEQEINKYLSKRYDLTQDYFNTSTSVPPLVRSLCRELSVGYTYKFLSRGRKATLDRAAEFINPVIENLTMLRDHEVDLLDTTGSIIPDLSTGSWRIQSTTNGYTDTFDDGDPLSWELDSDKQDDYDNDRSS